MLPLVETIGNGFLLSCFILFYALIKAIGKKSAKSIAQEMVNLDQNRPDYKEQFKRIESLSTLESEIGLLFVIPGIWVSIIFYYLAGLNLFTFFIWIGSYLYSMLWSRQNNQSTKYLELAGRTNETETRKAKIRNNFILVVLLVALAIFFGLNFLKAMIAVFV